MDALNLAQRPKKYLNITFTNGDLLQVGMPKKKVFDRIASIDLSKPNQIELVGDLYGLVAEILSNNRQGKNITIGYVEDMLDVDDVKALFGAYLQFVRGVSSDPN